MGVHLESVAGIRPGGAVDGRLGGDLGRGQVLCPTNGIGQEQFGVTVDDAFEGGGEADDASLPLGGLGMEVSEVAAVPSHHRTLQPTHHVRAAEVEQVARLSPVHAAGHAFGVAEVGGGRVAVLSKGDVVEAFRRSCDPTSRHHLGAIGGELGGGKQIGVNKAAVGAAKDLVLDDFVAGAGRVQGVDPGGRGDREVALRRGGLGVQTPVDTQKDQQGHEDGKTPARHGPAHLSHSHSTHIQQPGTNTPMPMSRVGQLAGCAVHPVVMTHTWLLGCQTNQGVVHTGALPLLTPQKRVWTGRVRIIGRPGGHGAMTPTAHPLLHLRRCCISAGAASPPGLSLQSLVTMPPRFPRPL